MKENFDLEKPEEHKENTEDMMSLNTRFIMNHGTLKRSEKLDALVEEAHKSVILPETNELIKAQEQAFEAIENDIIRIKELMRLLANDGKEKSETMTELKNFLVTKEIQKKKVLFEISNSNPTFQN